MRIIKLMWTYNKMLIKKWFVSGGDGRDGSGCFNNVENCNIRVFFRFLIEFKHFNATEQCFIQLNGSQSGGLSIFCGRKRFVRSVIKVDPFKARVKHPTISWHENGLYKLTSFIKTDHLVFLSEIFSRLMHFSGVPGQRVMVSCVVYRTQYTNLKI